MNQLLKTLLTATSVFLFAGATVYAQKHVYTEASEFTLTGKIMETPDPYHRVDTVKYKGFTPTENQQVRNSSGIAVAFRTNSSSISIITKYGYTGFPDNTNGISARGYDLYIRHNGKWLFAAANVRPQTSLEKPLSLIKDMPAGEKDCLLYLPTYSEEHSVKIGIDENSVIEPLENPFRYRIAIFGSSYTHGSSTSRAGLTYPAQFSRETGIQLLSLGCSGNCKLQSYFADVLKDVQADAFIFDTFSNPSPDQIRERLFPFIENIQTAHPDVPLIFQSTIYREGRNFSKAADNRARVRMAVADSLMKIAVVKYKNVYYVHPDATSKRHDTTVDGVHPTNYGYTLWAESIEKPVLKILRKYGMK